MTDPGAPDTGRQRERTRLAWSRTALAATAVSLLAARFAVGTRLTAPGALDTAVIAVLWLTVVTVCHLRIKALTGPQPTVSGRSHVVLVAAALGYALIGAVLLILR
jgi:uncharacterized membrane protein YidH (DUF202 family)